MLIASNVIGSAGLNALVVPASEPVSGATLEFQRSIATVDGSTRLLPDHHRIILPALKGQETASFDVRYAE